MAIPSNKTPTDRIVLTLGDASRGEFQPVIHWLRQLVSNSSRLISFEDVDRLLDHNDSAEQLIEKIGTAFVPASETLKSGEFPDLIVVLQSWPDEYSSRDVSRLLGFAPLARIVVVCGNWCESMGRTRNAWPMAVRVPIWAAPLRMQREWQSIQNPNSPNPPPWSASREEVFAYDHQGLENWFESDTVAIDTPDQAYRRYLIEMLDDGGAQVDQTKYSVLFFDAAPLNPSRANLLKQYRNENPQLVIVALVDQLDPLLISTLLELGTSSIVHKLGNLRQLTACFTDET